MGDYAAKLNRIRKVLDFIQLGGLVPWGAEVDFAYTSGYDSRGRVSVNHLVDERVYGVMLKKTESGR